ncbi:MAG: hypothetical protein IPK46_12755 [Saprospiraceae bacterium]|nr:hypothetical protein [Saprospiraceae bacterium]
MKTIFLFLIVMTTFTDTICAQAVGVGTSSPSDALHIVGASNDDPLRVQVGTATKLRVFNNGGTSLGTNNAAGTPANGLYVLGNTGLGVNNPIEKLEVGGNMNIIGEIKANGLAGEQGQLLQSNGNGTMSWIEPCGYQYSEDFLIPPITHSPGLFLQELPKSW